MTKDAALNMLESYCIMRRDMHCEDPILADIDDLLYFGGTKARIMRWLGFMQGVLYVRGCYSLDELKEHSRNGFVPLEIKRHDE